MSTQSDAGHNRNKTLLNNHIQRILPHFPSPSERYYDIRFVASENRRSYFGNLGDQCVMFHSNRVCLLTIAPTHSIITDNKTVDRVEFEFENGSDKFNRLTTQPIGKSKKNCQKLQKHSPVCAIHCSDGSRYVVTACLGAKLIEINEKLIQNPNLIKQHPLSLGYIAITQPNDWARMNEVRESLPKLSDILNV